MEPLTVLSTQTSSVTYIQDFLSKRKANRLYKFVFKLPLKRETVRVFGKLHEPRRSVTAFATKERYAGYRYAGTENRAKVPMPGPLNKLRKSIKRRLGFNANYVFLNMYPDATAGIGSHADDEPGIVVGSDIVGVSLGRSASFVFHPKKGGKKVGEQVLVHGSAAIMSGNCQMEFKHSVPAEKNPISKKHPPVDVGLEQPTNIRFSLTFRKNVASS